MVANARRSLRQAMDCRREEAKLPGQAEKQSKISKYNAKLIKYSPRATKSLLWGAFGAPEGGFGGGGAVFDQFGIVFAHF